MKTTIFFIAAYVLAISANAQVHCCTDAAGKISFSDVPCALNQKGERIGRSITLEEIALERSQAADARGRFLREQYEEQRPERERQAAIAAEKQAKTERRRDRVVCHSSGHVSGNSGGGGFYSGTTVCR